MWKLSHYAIVEAVEPFKLHPTSMSYRCKVFEHLKQLWMGIWQHTHTVTTTHLSPDLREFAENIYDVNVKTIPLRYRRDCIPFKLHPTSMSYKCELFEHLKQLWMGIWQHTHTFTTTDLSPDFGDFAEIIYDVNVKSIPLCYRRGCRTFQTASHIHVIQMQGV
jgi:hypothetical protein